jgi:hypothetical protein
MKLSEHADHLRQTITAAFDKQFARIGFGAVKQLPLEKIPTELHERRARFEEMITSHLGETGSYASAREKLIDELAFTLFNRIAAVKVMEAASLFPPIITRQAEHGGRSFGHTAWLEMHPDMRAEELEGIRAYILNAFDALGDTLPLYSRNYPYALLPDTIDLNEIIDAFNAVEKDTQVGEDIWHSDDVLGWLYESYNNAKKADFKDSGDKVEYDKVSLQSQVYTPRWVVKFLVDNSLGKLYLEMYPDSKIKEKYKIANAPEQREREIKPLHEVKLIDPACGSGNFLLYAFDLLYAMYMDQIEHYGAEYKEDKIPQLILKYNLYGIDLDNRAVQLAQLGLYIKARKKQRQISNLTFNIVSSDFYLPDYAAVKHIFEDGTVLDRNQKALIADVWGDLQLAYKFGSLIRLEQKIKARLSDLVSRREKVDTQPKSVQRGLFLESDIQQETLFAASFFENLKIAVEKFAQKQGKSFLATKTRDAVLFLELLNTKYEVAITNPPYTDSSDFGLELKEFIQGTFKKYEKFHTNLYATFIKRCYELTKEDGKFALIHPLTFMYIKTFEDVRKFIINKTHINLLAELGLGGVFPNSNVQVDVCMYILEKVINTKKGTYFDLKKYKNHINKPIIFKNLYSRFIEGIIDKHVFCISQSKLKIIKSWPFIYWISDEFREKFKSKSFEDYYKIAVGLMTGNNQKFLRFFWEIDSRNISKSQKDDKKRWVPYQKGGNFNKWYGNNWLLVDYSNDGKYLASRSNNKFYFRDGITYSATSSKGVSFRLLPPNQIFDIKGSCIFKMQPEASLSYACAILNSKTSSYIIKCLNATVETQTGDVKRIPFIFPKPSIQKEINRITLRCVAIKKFLCRYSLVDNYEFISPLSLNKGIIEGKAKIKTFLNLENHLQAQILLNEAFINEKIFEVYELSEQDKVMVLEIEGESIGGLPISEEARGAYLTEEIATKEFSLNSIQDYIKSLPVIKFPNKERKIIESDFPSLYRGNNNLEEFCIRHHINPINIWYWFTQSNVISQQRMNTLLLEFLADMICDILMEDEDGIIPLVPNAGENFLIERIEEKFQEKDFSMAQYSQFGTMLGQPLEKYINNGFFANLSSHLKLFKRLPATPFIWHLTSGPEQGFDCYIIIYKWSRDKLLRIRSTYIERRKQALINRQSDLNGNNSADAQNEKEKIRKQLLEIEDFKSKIDELLAEGYDPILDDGVGKNIAPLQAKGMLPYEVLNKGQLKKYLNADW